jgi:hypothetical protein
VTADVRLAEIVSALEGAGITCLVMGGHAVRYYGLERNTIDFDLHLAPDCWDDLLERLRQMPLLSGQPPVEGPSWRPGSFRRFSIGRLPDGRDEWLEFWRSNHLLPAFAEVFARYEEGMYGGRLLPFLALPDLIRSKETERGSDWQDVAALEEILDARRLAAVQAGQMHLTVALAEVRSRRGFESHLQQGSLDQRTVVDQALSLASRAVAQGYLIPFASPGVELPTADVLIEPVILDRLWRVAPACSLHLALVEAIRRRYRTAAQAEDRADKQAYGDSEP